MKDFTDLLHMGKKKEGEEDEGSAAAAVEDSTISSTGTPAASPGNVMTQATATWGVKMPAIKKHIVGGHMDLRDVDLV